MPSPLIRLETAPDLARAMTLMGLGRLKDGFEAYEVRLDPDLTEAMSGGRCPPDACALRS